MDVLGYSLARTVAMRGSVCFPMLFSASANPWGIALRDALLPAWGRS